MRLHVPSGSHQLALLQVLGEEPGHRVPGNQVLVFAIVRELKKLEEVPFSLEGLAVEEEVPFSPRGLK